MLTMCAMIWRKYCRGKLLQTKVFFRSFYIPDGACYWSRMVVYAVSTVGALLIIGTRLHYTVSRGGGVGGGGVVVVVVVVVVVIRGGGGVMGPVIGRGWWFMLLLLLGLC